MLLTLLTHKLTLGLATLLAFYLHEKASFRTFLLYHLLVFAPLLALGGWVRLPALNRTAEHWPELAFWSLLFLAMLASIIAGRYKKDRRAARKD